MKKLVIFLLLLAILVEGFIYFRGRATVEWFAKSQFKKETGLNLVFEDWELRGNVLSGFKPKIVSDKPSEDETISADFVQVHFDASNILHRKLIINDVLVVGLQINSPSKESSFFQLLDAIIRDDPNAKLDKQLITLRGRDFKISKLKIDSTTVELQPSNIEFNFSDKKKPLVKAESPLEVSLGLPPVLSNLNKIVGDVAISGELLSPEIASSLKFQNSDLIQLTGGLYKGVLTIRPVVQANTEGGEKTTARGELQLNKFKLIANDFTIKGLPLGLINPAFENSQSEILSKGELNLLNLTGDLWGAIRVSNIESLPVALKDLKLEVAISDRELKIKEGSFKGDAGNIELTGGYNLENKKLSGQLRTEKLLIKAPDIRARIPRGIQLSSAINFSGNLNEPKINGALELGFFKLGLNGESVTEALVPSQLELTINRKSLKESRGIWKIQPLDIETQGREIKTAVAIPIEVSDAVLTLPETEISVGDKKVKIRGKISEQGYDFSALGNAEVFSLVGRKDNIEDIDGDISVRLSVQGPLDSPQLSGEVNLTDGAFSIPLSGDRFHLEEIAGKITFDDKKIILENFQNTAGDARVKMNGELNDFLTPQRSGSIQAKFEQVAVQPDPNLIIHLHAVSELNLLPGGQPLVTGKITIDDALYEQRSNLQELVKKLLGLLVKGSQTATSRQLSSPVLAEISINADRSMVVDTDIFQGELSSDIDIIANPQEVKIDGRISGDSGELILGRNKFDVSLIKVSFNDQELGSLPKFDLKADGELGPRGSAEQVQLKVSGMLPSPGIQLSSESARSQKELLAELGLGVDKLSVFSNQSRSTPSLIGALNPFSGAGLKDRVGELTGGASIQVESGYSADTGTFAPRLLLEQPLPFTFRLVAQSELSQFNRSEVNLEYPLTDQTNIFTGWKNAPTTKNPENLSGSLGVGVHYRERFPGTLVLPGNLLLENLEHLLGLSNDDELFDEEPKQ